MPDRAANKLHITAAPIYNSRISSAYALSDFDSTIVLCVREKLRPTDKQQIQFTAIGLPDTDVSKYNCDTQESALGGRGIIATVILMLFTATASNIKMEFDSVDFSMMALLLSFL